MNPPVFQCGDVLDDACGANVRELFGAFFNAVAAATDKDSEMVAAAERFRKGIELLSSVHAKAKDIIGVAQKGKP